MGFLKFVIPFVGGALTVAAANAAKKKLEERSQNENGEIEIEAEFEEKSDENDI